MQNEHFSKHPRGSSPQPDEPEYRSKIHRRRSKKKVDDEGRSGSNADVKSGARSPEEEESNLSGKENQ